MSKERYIIGTGMLLLLFSLVQADGIYKWTDANGKVHFADRPPQRQDAEKIELRINTYEGTQVSQHALLASKEVIMYSAEWCGVCKKARAYFRKNRVPFKEYDIDTNTKGKRDFKRLNARGVPVILVGNQRLNGFTPASFERLYKAK